MRRIIPCIIWIIVLLALSVMVHADSFSNDISSSAKWFPFLMLSLLVSLTLLWSLARKKKRNGKDNVETAEQLPLTPDAIEYINYNLSAFKAALTALQGRYIVSREVSAFKAAWLPVYQKIKIIRLPSTHPSYSSAQSFFQQFEHIDDTIDAINNAYITREKQRCNDLLSSIDGKSLDDQQRTVVVCDADRNLVLAGAGSGKTLTIAGKVKYLVQEKAIHPEDILLIAFTKKSAEEMTHRIAGRLDIPVSATTFHKLGLDIITHNTKMRPDVLDDLSKFVETYFEKYILNSPHEVKKLLHFFAYYLSIPANFDNFESLGEAYNYEKSHDLETLRQKYNRAKLVDTATEERNPLRITLNNESVKSLAECEIANFLFLNGIRYEYEALYPHKSENTSRKAYRPDFYLPDYDIYIEHFGINRQGKLPWLSAVEEQKYLQDMEWKRSFHQKNHTTLLETYSYYASEGTLLNTLEELLKAHHVIFQPLDYLDVFNTIYANASNKYFAEFINLCSTFITLFKSNGYPLNLLPALTCKNQHLQNNFRLQRTEAFKEIIAPVIASYNKHLADNNAIDFADMINQATAFVEKHGSLRQYKWVIIDEYQDISMGRYRLVSAILEKTGAKLLCVGDDWQSIYRFAGSDISLFTNFEQYFGKAAVMYLEQTYRNSQQLIDEAGRFVMKNPSQLRKSLSSAKKLDYPITFMTYGDNQLAILRRVLRKIIHDFGKHASIMLLGRTNYDLEVLRKADFLIVKSPERITFADSPETPLFFLTVHKAKGLEADNVVLLNFQDAALGFPNKISDDPVLELVLAQDEAFDYAEERRLFYVALTRTKNRIFILVNEFRPSTFFSEFSQSKSVFTLSSSAQKTAVVNCPRCKTGNLTTRKNEETNTFFVGCTNYPACQYTLNDINILNNAKACPQCGGFLIQHAGVYGNFYGCSNYPLCRYTLQIPPIKSHDSPE